jgi:flavin-dependent dehydrogenase
LRADLARGLLSVIAFRGGYGGIVEAENGLATLACCIRRDTLVACRERYPGVGAGSAVEAALRDECGGLRQALQSATRVGPWLAVGPIRPGIRVGRERAAPLAGVFRVGNAAGETHPLIGEGITMALHSAALLSRRLGQESPGMIDALRATALHSAYESEWRRAFARRLRFAAVYSQIAMRPTLARAAGAGLRLWPRLLTEAARRAGKARRADLPLTWHEEFV